MQEILRTKGFQTAYWQKLEHFRILVVAQKIVCIAAGFAITVEQSEIVAQLVRRFTLSYVPRSLLGESLGFLGTSSTRKIQANQSSHGESSSGHGTIPWMHLGLNRVVVYTFAGFHFTLGKGPTARSK